MAKSWIVKNTMPHDAARIYLISSQLLDRDHRDSAVFDVAKNGIGRHMTLED